MKLLFITHVTGGGGAARSLLALLKQLPTEWTKLIASPFRDQGSAIRQAGFQMIDFGIPPPPMGLVAIRKNFSASFGDLLHWLVRIWRLPMFRKQIRLFKPDFIILNSYLCIWLVPFFASKYRVVLFAREMLALTRCQRIVYLPILRNRVAHVICISQNERKQLAELGINHSTVIFNCNDSPIDAQVFAARAAKRVQDSPIRVGIFGKVTQEKGQHLVIDACLRYRSEFTACRISFVIVGDTEGMKNSVEENNLTDLINLTGWAEDIEPLMNEIDILLRPDLTGSPWGRDIIEGMCRALPIIASGTSTEMIQPGLTGELFPAGDVDAMAKFIVKLASDRALRDAYAERSLEFAIANFSPETHAGKFIQLLSKLQGECQLI